jgi:hypothetical protein
MARALFAENCWRVSWTLASRRVGPAGGETGIRAVTIVKVGLGSSTAAALYRRYAGGAVAERGGQSFVDGRLKFENRWRSIARFLRIKCLKVCDAFLQALDASPLLPDRKDWRLRLGGRKGTARHANLWGGYDPHVGTLIILRYTPDVSAPNRRKGCVRFSVGSAGPQVMRAASICWNHIRPSCFVDTPHIRGTGQARLPKWSKKTCYNNR